MTDGWTLLGSWGYEPPRAMALARAVGMEFRLRVRLELTPPAADVIEIYATREDGSPLPDDIVPHIRGWADGWACAGGMR